MFKILNILIFIFSLIPIPIEVFARCAVCYTKGLSGASIALIVIISSFTLLFFYETQSFFFFLGWTTERPSCLEAYE